MKFVLLLSVLTLLSCDHRDPHEPWYPHIPTAPWRVTPAGHWRDAGPFGSVQDGWTDEVELDVAVDDGFQRFSDRLGFQALEIPVALNDDYTLWVVMRHGGIWASGVYTTGEGMLHSCIWSRVEAAADPGPCWISRPPGNYWGVYYPTWRYAARPLAPALSHELLHVSIGDPDHLSPLWSKLEGAAKSAAMRSCEGRF